MRATHLPSAFALSLLVLAALTLGSAIPASVEAQSLAERTYHFGTHPARTAITFVSEADLETIHGVTNAVEGKARLDARGRRATGALRIRVDSLKTGIALRDEHLRSADWLDAKRHPYIDLALTDATVQADGRTWKLKARITIKGVTRDLETTANVQAFPDEVAKVLGPGSWIRVRTRFPITLRDFGIVVPQQVGAKVSGTWQIGVDLYGTTAAPQKAK